MVSSSMAVTQAISILGTSVDRYSAARANIRGATHNFGPVGLGGAITFTGHRMDVRDVLAMSNLVFSLSRKPESFGRTVRESLSLGVPVVGYDHGGVGETLHAAYPSGRVAVGDLDALESVTRELLEHPVEVAPQRFTTVEDMIDSTLELYRSLVEA